MPPTNAEYAKINIACKSLGIDKYDLIADRYSLESTKNLTRQQTFDLLAHFGTLGWKPTRKKGNSKKSKSSPVYESPQMRKVVAMWITLADADIVRNRANYALQNYVKRLTGKANLAWCKHPDFKILIASLKAMGKDGGVDFE